jgi:hypothetical protein
MMPIDILQTDTVGKSAAQSVSARKAVEPFLKRRIREASVVTRAYEWFGTNTVTHSTATATVSLYIVVTTTSPAIVFGKHGILFGHLVWLTVTFAIMSWDAGGCRLAVSPSRPQSQKRPALGGSNGKST